MTTSLGSISFQRVDYTQYSQSTLKTTTQTGTVGKATDTVELGKGTTLSTDQSMSVVYERAMNKLKSVVDDARKALGLSETDQLDTSPEATAGRIADFALGAYDSWQKRHTGLSDEESRKQFADFIGGAIQQGISEARSILGSLNALTSEVDTNIDKTWNIIEQRLTDFVNNKQ